MGLKEGRALGDRPPRVWTGLGRARPAVWDLLVSSGRSLV